MPSTGRTPYANLPQWVLTEKPAMQDFNEAFANTDTALANLDSSINTGLSQKMNGINLQGGRVNLYVRPVGNDDNPGTSAAPFQTMGRAVKEAAKYVGGQVNIRLTNGSYVEPQEIIMDNFSTVVHIIAEDTANPDVTLMVERIQVRACRAIFSRLKLVGLNSKLAVIQAHTDAIIWVQNCVITGQDDNSAGIYADNSSARISNTEINRCQIAIRALADSSIWASGNTGSGNYHALLANASRIIVIGTYPDGTIRTHIPNSGQILGVD